MEKLILFGNGVFAQHVHYLVTHDGAFDVAAFTVDGAFIGADRLSGLPVVPFENVEALYPPSTHRMLVAVSFQRVNRLREEKYLQAKRKGYRLAGFRSSRASTYPDLTMGENSIVLESAVIGPFVTIGDNVVVASGAIIGHHTIIADHCFVSPGAVILGGARVDAYCLIGANATVKEEVTVARECLVGSGVDITRDTRERGVYLNPPPVLHSRRSDELLTWLTWPSRSARTARGEEETADAHR